MYVRIMIECNIFYKYGYIKIFTNDNELSFEFWSGRYNTNIQNCWPKNPSRYQYDRKNFWTILRYFSIFWRYFGHFWPFFGQKGAFLGQKWAFFGEKNFSKILTRMIWPRYFTNTISTRTIWPRYLPIQYQQYQYDFKTILAQTNTRPIRKKLGKNGRLLRWQ